MRTSAVLRKLVVVTGSAAAASFLTVLLVPRAAGWVQPNVPRAAILDRALTYMGDVAGTEQAKFVSAADLAAAFPEDPPHSGNLWVVIASHPVCSPVCGRTGWSGIVLDDRLDSGGNLAPPAENLRVDSGVVASLPSRFDALKDRAAPEWWLVPVAPPVVAWTAVVGAAVFSLLATLRLRGHSPPTTPLPKAPIGSGAR